VVDSLNQTYIVPPAPLAWFTGVKMIKSHSICGLMLHIVELWYSVEKTGSVPLFYEMSMTSYCQEYERRTGDPCDTVATIQPLEDWYGTLSEEDKTRIREDKSFRITKCIL